MPTSLAPTSPLSTGLRAFVNIVPKPLPKPLPLVHITDAASARCIFAEGYLAVRKCRHFSKLLERDEVLIYLSYGRPSYRGKKDDKFDMGWIRKPVAFIFRPESVESAVSRVFPFDSGAYFLRKLDTWIDINALPITEFELTGTIDSARKVVKKFYKSNRNYLALRPTEKLAYDAGNFEVDGLWNMINAKAKDGADDRRKVIEIQVHSPLKVNATNIVAVVVPDECLDSPQWLAWIDALGLSPTCYLNNGALHSREGWDALLFNKTMEILRDLA